MSTPRLAITMGVADRRSWDAAVVLGMVALVLLLPPAIFGYLSYRQFDFFRFSWYVPYEEVWAAWRSLELEAILNAPLVSTNMTSGFLLSNVYAVDLQQLMLSVALGAAMGLNVAAFRALGRVCRAGSASGAAAGGGFGLFATVSASSTGIMGCCGAGAALGGGVLALAGLGSTTAAQVAAASPLIQLALVAAFAANWWRLRRRLRALLD